MEDKIVGGGAAPSYIDSGEFWLPGSAGKSFDKIA